MARIPTYDELQVAPAPLRGPNLGTVASPELFGEAARQQAELGKGLTSAGTGVVAVASVIQERENADSVLRAETALKDEYLKYERDAQANRQGRNAVGLTEDTQKWWDEALKRHGDKLGNDAQRRAFALRLGATRHASVQSLSRFEAQHREKSWLDSEAAATGATISIAASNPTNETIANAKGAILGATERIARAKGWTPEVLASERMKLTTGLHQEVFNNLLQKDYLAAKSYFEANKAEIDGAKHDAFAKQLREGGKDTLAQNYGDASLAAGLTLEQALDKARKELSGPEEEHVVARLRQRYKEQSENIESEVNKAILSGADLRAVQAMPAFAKLDGEAQRKIVGFMEQQAYTREARAAARESRLDAAESRAERGRTRDGWASFFDYSDPEKLKSMSRAQVANLLPTLGAQHTAALLARWDSFEKNPAKFTEAKIDADLFNGVAEEFKLEPFKNKKSPEDKARLGQVRNLVEQEIGALQAEAKKPLTRDEKERVMRQVLAREVQKPTWFGLSSEAAPAAAVLPKEKVVIPAADREAIRDALTRRGQQATEENIRRWYLIGRQRGAE